MPLPESETSSELATEMMEEYPTKNYKVNFSTNQIEGYTDGLDSLKQYFLLAMNTQRYSNKAFTSNFGMDWTDLIGMPDDYIVSEVLTRVQDMVLADNRFLSVDYYEDNPFTINGDSIIINLTVKTTEGDFEAEVNVTK